MFIHLKSNTGEELGQLISSVIPRVDDALYLGQGDEQDSYVVEDVHHVFPIKHDPGENDLPFYNNHDVNLIVRRLH